MYTIKINGQFISVDKYKTTVVKSVKVSKVAFDFDESWKDLNVFACFKNSNIGNEYIIKITEPYETEIPWEVLEVAGKLEVGALGLNDNGIVKPTIWCAVSDIVNGVSTDGTIPADATPNVVAQITEIADNAVNIAQSVRDDANAGKFNGKDGKDGVSGVYVGDGDMPEGYNVQIDPTGDADLFIGEGVSF